MALSNPSFNDHVPLMYFGELKINICCCSIFDWCVCFVDNCLSFLIFLFDITLSVLFRLINLCFLITSLVSLNFENDRQLLSQIYDKLYDFYSVMVNVPFLSIIIPVFVYLTSSWYSRACSYKWVFFSSMVQVNNAIRATINLYLNHLVRNSMADIMC
jgi:hypothetical protein